MWALRFLCVICVPVAIPMVSAAPRVQVRSNLTIGNLPAVRLDWTPEPRKGRP